jgi:putative Mn2+ efflux pump MntP
MYLHLLLNSFLLSVDSLVVSLALGPLIVSPAQRCFLAALFGGCDGLAVLAGSLLGQSIWAGDVSQKIVPLCALAYGVCCLVAAFWNKFRANSNLAFVLPVLMSFDNFAYGVGAGPLTANVAIHAAFFGLTSFSLALLGILLWSAIPLPNVRIRERFAGFALVACGLGLLFI